MNVTCLILSLCWNAITGAEAKGRENYLCWNQYISILAKQTLDEEQQHFISAILTWARIPKPAIAKTSSPASSCVTGACCQPAQLPGTVLLPRQGFHFKMLKRLEKADILIVNHSCCFPTWMVDNSILPEYRYLIIDEAHTFERESFERLAAGFSREECQDILRMLYSKEAKHERGYLQYLKGRYPTLMPALNQLSSTVYRCGEYLQACFDAIKPVKPRDNHALVLEQQDFDSPWFAELVDQYTGWQQLMNLLIHQCSELKAELSGTDEEMAVNAVLQSLRRVRKCLCGHGGIP